MSKDRNNLCKWTTACLVAGIFFSIAIIITVGCEENPGWKKHFYQQNPAHEGEVSINQVYLKDDNVADRCITCHLDKNVIASNEVHTLHPYYRFACSTCHDGNGRSLKFSEIHKTSGRDEKVALAEMREKARASCALCHSQRYYSTNVTESDYGRVLVTRLGCAECHEIPGLKFNNERLDLISLIHKVRPGYLSALLEQRNSKVTITRSMPYFAFSTEDTADLVSYLLTLEEYRKYPPFGRLKSGDAIEGQKLFDRIGCSKCHVTAQFPDGGDKGPSLAGLGYRVSRSWLNEWMRNSRKLIPFSEMPVYDITEDEVRMLVAYLAASAGKDPYKARENTGNAAKGKRLFDENYCLACHTTDGTSIETRVGPVLNGIASRDWKKLPFVDLDPALSVGNSIKSRLELYLGDVRTFEKYAGREIAMPPFQLQGRELEPIVSFIMSLRKFEPSLALRSGAPFRKAEIRGEYLFTHRSCYLCHSTSLFSSGMTRGEGLAKAKRLQGPNLSHIGQKARSGWFEDWLSNPRTVLEHSTMPDPKLAADEIADVSAYLRSLKGGEMWKLVNEVPEGVEALDKGEKLFGGAYCLRCHKVEGRGVAAYRGPELSNVGVKITPEFLVKWLHRAGDIQPDTEMDDFGMSEIEALQVYLFLRSLRNRPGQK